MISQITGNSLLSTTAGAKLFLSNERMKYNCYGMTRERNVWMTDNASYC